MGADCEIVMWGFGGAEAPAEFVKELREAFPDLLLVEGDAPPDTRCEMLIIWSGADAPAVETVAREARQSGLAHVVAIIAPGACGILAGPTRDFTCTDDGSNRPIVKS